MPHPRLGINCHQAGSDALHLAASLGIGWVRIDANVNDIWREPTTWDFQWLDEMLATCRTLGLEPYPTITQSPRWQGVEPGEPPPLHHWVTFCETFARRYADQLTFVGCYNEFTGSASEYVSRLLQPMAEIFRRVDAGYKIVGPELQMNDGWDIRLLDILTQGGEMIDVISVHTYSAQGSQVWDKLTKPRRWWELIWKDPSVLHVIAQAKETVKPLWLTETGFRSDEMGEDGQARQADEILERVLEDGRIAKVLFFQLLDESPAGGHGVFRMDGTLKPAGAVIQRHAGRPST